MQGLKSAAFVRVGAETVGRSILVMTLALMIAGCNQTGLTPTPVPNPATGQNQGDVKYYPSDQPARLGIQRFYEGNFGLAQQYFQDAVEKSPGDVTAWIGDWLQVTIDWGDSTSRTKPTWPQPNLRASLSDYLITKAIRICCEATLRRRDLSFKQR